jgi:hypothetical protein
MANSLLNDSPELKLILLSAYLKPDSDISILVKHMTKEPLKWSEIQLLLKIWQIHPYFFQFIKNQELQSYVPEQYLQQFQKVYQNQAMRTIYLKRQIKDINDHFTKNNISYCLIKGADLIQTIYSDQPVRPMSDIDILCHPKDIHKIKHILSKLGYFQKTMHQSDALEFLATNRKHYPAFFHKNRHTIEVHFNLFSGAANQNDLTSELWAHANQIENTSQFRLNKNHHLLYLCHHLAYHIQSPREGLVLYWFFDIYQLMKQYQIEMNSDLYRAMSSEDRGHIDSVYKIIDYQWIKQDHLNHHLNKIHTPLVAILNQNLRSTHSDRIKKATSYYWQVLSDKHPQWSFLKRFIYLFRLFFPKFSYLKDRYQVHQKWMLPFYFIFNPFMVMFRAIKRMVR